MSETTYYETNRDVILNREKDYYENNKKLLKERANNKCRQLSEYGRHRHRNMSEEKKQRLKGYQKTYCEVRKHL